MIAYLSKPPSFSVLAILPSNPLAALDLDQPGKGVKPVLKPVRRRTTQFRLSHLSPSSTDCRQGR